MKVKIQHLIWDNVNKSHIKKHNITRNQVKYACINHIRYMKSYRNRIVIQGHDSKGKLIEVVLSPEDKDLQKYKPGVYYVITAYEKRR